VLSAETAASSRSSSWTGGAEWIGPAEEEPTWERSAVLESAEDEPLVDGGGPELDEDGPAAGVKAETLLARQSMLFALP